MLQALKRPVGDGGSNSIQPRTAVGVTWRGERRARELFRIQSIGTALRRIAPQRQRYGQRFSGKFVAEAALVFYAHSSSDSGAAKPAVYYIAATKVANWTSMVMVSQPGRVAPAADDLKGRIASFMEDASTEITPSEESRLAELAAVLPPGSSVYVAHTPNAGFAQVIHTALAVRRAGFLATPHIAVRRVPDARTLRAALAELRAAGVEQILLIAGDAPRPVGEFFSTLDVLESGIIQES